MDWGCWSLPRWIGIISAVAYCTMYHWSAVERCRLYFIHVGKRYLCNAYANCAIVNPWSFGEPSMCHGCQGGR